jgi:hypothetical protein
MDEKHIDNSSDRTISLEQQAELLFPMPEKACAYKQMRIKWQREKWVKSQLNTCNSNVLAQANQS